MSTSRFLRIGVVIILLAIAPRLPSGAGDSADRPWAPSQERIQACLAKELPSLEKLYTHLHAHPELAFEEVQTAARLAKELQQIGFAVTTKVGGHGVVGVFKNGAGPTVMVRADMDALPITENTGLPYASKARTRDRDGKDVGIMHACGHDMHMTCWVGTARTLVALKDHWQGTIVFIGQPAEEVGGGARRMIEDGLFKRFPRPDYCLGLHCSPQMAHGTIGYSEGLLLANVDTVDITVRGKGGHGSAPHLTIDPIVIAARIVLDLQTLISRERNPLDPAVITVGSIHGGTKHNIIPSEVKLQITVRSFTDAVRKSLLEGIQRVSQAAAKSANAPDPIVRFEIDDWCPALYNDPALSKKTAGLLKNLLGKENIQEIPPIMGGEDFSRYGREGVPIFFYFLGTSDPDKVADAKKGGPQLPGMHSEFYYPVPAPSIRTGVTSMSLSVLNLLKTKEK